MANSIAPMSVMVVGDKTYQIVDENAVTDVQVNGSSIVSNNIANITTIPNITVSSSQPSGGSNGDIWFVVS